MVDKRDEMCLDSLLAEVEQLRGKVALQRRLADRRNENLVKLDEENQQLQTELARVNAAWEREVKYLQAEIERLRAELAAAREALPDAELLGRAAEYADIVWYRRRLVTGDSDLAPSDRDALRAAARIREAQGAGSG